MEYFSTKAGDAGAFRHFDLTRVPSPCFVVDEVRLQQNLALLQQLGEDSGARILLALKAFSMWSVADLIGRHLHGCCASGLHEAMLARKHFHGELTTFAAAYKDSEFDQIAALSDHIIFNTPAQMQRFAGRHAGKQIGLRINPQHSEGETAKYDPCAPCSRLGTPLTQLDPSILQQLDGIHLHTLCEQDFPPLQRTFAAVEAHFGDSLRHLKWINLGGGHHMTRADYQLGDLVEFVRTLRSRYDVDLYLEPGEAVALDAGILVGEILDVLDNGMPLAITDISATCHMPDVIEAPYRPAMLNEAHNGAHHYRLGGPSCLAGDVIGDYGFHSALAAGQRIAFLDQGHYSMVKTNTFNGIGLPAIALWNSQSDTLRLVRQFDFDDFEERLS